MKNAPSERSGLTVTSNGSSTARPAHHERHALLRVDVAQGDGGLQVAELPHLLAGDFEDLVAGPQIGLPGGIAGKDLADDAGRRRHADPGTATTAIRKAKITFMITPAEMIAIRFGTLLARKLRGS